MHSTKLKKAQDFFKAHGKSSVFLSRLLPTLRVYISFVAGIAHMDKKHFILYTLYGYTLLNLLWFLTGYLSHLVVQDITKIDTQNFTLYSIALFFIFLFLYVGSKYLLKRFIK
jgi:membrane protein DedA with SNARE-associated domain